MSLKITLHKDMDDFIVRLIASGRYHSESDVVNDALFCFRDKEMLREAKLTALRAEIQKGLDSGPAEDIGDMFERIKSEGRRRLTAKDAAE